jgi:hypothetical protein
MLHGRVQVEALERQMVGLATLRSLVQEMQISVDGLTSAQGDLRAEVTQHCTHTSSLLTRLQVRRASPLLPPSRISTCCFVEKTQDHQAPAQLVATAL